MCSMESNCRVGDNVLRKGSQLGLEGKIQTRNYEDPNVPGRRVYVVKYLSTASCS